MRKGADRPNQTIKNLFDVFRSFHLKDHQLVIRLRLKKLVKVIPYTASPTVGHLYLNRQSNTDNIAIAIQTTPD